jgi:hypothetical protein
MVTGPTLIDVARAPARGAGAWFPACAGGPGRAFAAAARAAMLRYGTGGAMRSVDGQTDAHSK